MPTRLLPDPSSFLHDMRSVLRSVAALADAERARRRGWAPTPKSLAAQDRADGKHLVGEWGDPLDGVFGMATAQLMAARESIEAQARLLEDPPTSIAHLVLARAAIEASSRAWGLLDPDLSIDDRVSMWATLRIHELWEIRKLGEPYATGLALDAQVDRIRRSATAAGLTGGHPKGGAPFVGKARESVIGQIRSQFKSEGLLASGIDMYRVFSGAVHGHSDVVGRSSVREGDGSTAMTLLPENLVLPVMAAGTGYGSALVRLFEYLGWPTREIDEELARSAVVVTRWNQECNGGDSADGRLDVPGVPEA